MFSRRLTAGGFEVEPPVVVVGPPPVVEDPPVPVVDPPVVPVVEPPVVVDPPLEEPPVAEPPVLLGLELGLAAGLSFLSESLLAK